MRTATFILLAALVWAAMAAAIVGLQWWQHDNGYHDGRQSVLEEIKREATITCRNGEKDCTYTLPGEFTDY